MKFKITLMLSLFVSVLNAQSTWQGLGSAPFSSLITSEFEMVMRPNGHPVVAYVDPIFPNDVQVTEWNGSSWQMLTTITPILSPDLTDLNLISNDANIYLGIGSISGFGYEVYRLDGAVWTSLEDGAMNLQNLNYTPNTVKIAVSDQLNNITLTYSSFGGAGDVPSAMLYDFPSPGEWDPTYGNDLNTLFTNDIPNETNSKDSRLFQNGPNTYYYSTQTDPAQGPWDHLRLYKYEFGTWSVLPLGGEDFIQIDPNLFSIDGNQAAGLPTISYTENSQPDLIKFYQMDGAGGYTPLLDFNPGAVVNAMDLTLDNADLPYVAHSFGTSNNRLIHFNGSGWDAVSALDFHTGSVSEIDMEVFQSSNKIYILFLTDGGLKIKVYNEGPVVLTSPTVTNICQDASSSTIVSDLELVDNDHDSIYVVSASSSDGTIIQNANIVINRTSVYDYNSSANHFEVLATPDPGQSGPVDITVVYSDGIVTNSEVISLVVNPTPTFSPLADEFLCFNGSFFLSASGPHTYVWDSGDLNNSTVTPAATGTFTYTVTATDANGCIATDMMDVTVYPLPTFSVSVSDVSCSGGSDGEIILSGLNASQNYDVYYDFNASPAGPFTLTSNAAGDISISPLAFGTYENISVLDNSSGCFSNTSPGPYTIVNPSPININPLADETHCEGTSVTLTGNATGGTGVINYVWDNGVTNGNAFTPAATNTYTLTATDQNGCWTSDNLDITINPLPPTFTTSQINPATCGATDGSITIEGLLASTLYDLAYNDGAVQNLPSSVTDASGNFQITGLSAGNYSNIEVTNSNGCIRSLAGPIALSDPGAPYVDPINDFTICANDNLGVPSFTGTSGATFSWANDNTTIGLAASGTGDISNFTTINTGSSQELATLMVTPTLGGCTGSLVTFTIAVDPLDNASFNYSNSSYCLNSSNPIPTSIVTAGGIFSYTVISGGPTISLNSSTGEIDFTSSTAGTYTITYTTSGLCQNNATSNITLNTNPSITITQPLVEVCNNASPLNMNGIATPIGGTYIGEGIVNNHFNPNPLPVDGYSYSYVYTDANGCSSSDFGTIGILEIPDISLAITNTTCGNNTGSAISTVTGGATPYNYYWSNGTDGPEITNLAATTYYLNVTDMNNCYVMDVAAIQSTAINVSSSVTDNNCAGDNNGEIDLIVSGTTGPYTYFWSNGAITEDITNLASGQYEVFVTDSDGCTSSHTATVQSPGTFSNEMTTTLPSACGALDGSILASIEGGVPAYNYEWKNETGTVVGSSSLLSNVGQGVYTLTVLDVAGCNVVYNAVLSETGAPQISVDQITSASCLNDGAINISVTSTNPIVSTNWSNLETSEDIAGLVNGFYSVKITDDIGCVGNLGVNVNPVYPDYIDICMVTVNETTNTNLVVWEKPITTEIDHYIIYRETSVAGQFLPVGTVDYDDESLFTDPIAYPQLRSWRYKLGVVNTCGVASELSPAHKTMHITISQEVGGVYTINWDNYEGFNFPSFDLYRFTDASGWELISALPTTTFSYTDTPPSIIGLDYVVSIAPPVPCTSSKAQDHNASRSNTTSSINIGPGENNGNTDQITETELENSILIYPNPSASIFNVHMNVKLTNSVMVNVYDIRGSIVKSFEIDNSDFIVQLKDVDNGMYILEINTGKAIVRKQLIKK